MRQFLLPAGWDGSPRLRLGAREGRHLLRVLRLGPGDRFPALDASGLRHDCEILALEGEEALIAVGEGRSGRGAEELPDLRGKGEPRPRPPGHRARSPLHGGAEPSRPPGWIAGQARPPREGPGPEAEAGGPTLPRIVLAAGLLKGEKFDLVLRQAAEAGAARVLPLETERSYGSPGGGSRRERQERILREALQQSGSPIPTSLEAPCPLRELPARLGPPREGRLLLLLHEAPLAEASLHRYLGSRPDEVVLCVGPEGGFAPDEVAFLLDSGFLPLRLPGAVLRAETAALFALAAVEIVASEHSAWSRAQA